MEYSTLCIYVDNLLITSKSKEMIAALTDGEITLKHGPNINYLSVSFDFTHSGEARLTMTGYVHEILSTSGASGTARTPATDTLFDADDSELVSEPVRVWFHRVVAQILYRLVRYIRWSCAETGGAWYGSEVVCGCILWCA
jgi:hypothetical protein